MELLGITKMAKKIIDDNSDSFKSYPNISKQIKQNLPTKCKDLDKVDFLGFKKLFDLIKTIKGS